MGDQGNPQMLRRLVTVVVLVMVLAMLGVMEADAAGDRPVWVRLPGADALVVVDQGREYGFVSDRGDAVTLFEAAWARGSIGLLAHDYLIGGRFYGLALGDMVRVGLEGGEVRQFVLREIRIYEAVEPGVPWTAVSDEQGVVWSQDEVFEVVYGNGGLVLQTCWGGLYQGWWFGLGEAVSEAHQVFMPMVETGRGVYRGAGRVVKGVSRLE